jgi:hypothetical protein
MISPDILKQIITVLKDAEVPVFRYKNGDEEIEIITTPPVGEDMETTKESTNLIGFHVKSFDDMEEVE